MSRTSIGTSCVKNIQVTDRFKRMISEAHKAQKIILEMRASDLVLWTRKEQDEFRKIFGFDGDDMVDDVYSSPSIAKGREKKTARDLMKEGISRMQLLCDSLSIDNFSNLTDCGNYYARVSETQTIALDPSKYSAILKIDIGQKFVNTPLYGINSQVCTLCHELSHFKRYVDKVDAGGMSTDDITDNRKPREIAIEMRNKKDPQLFLNAYNIEMYFEKSSS
jgi:hypothetical protein